MNEDTIYTAIGRLNVEIEAIKTDIESIKKGGDSIAFQKLEKRVFGLEQIANKVVIASNDFAKTVSDYNTRLANIEKQLKNIEVYKDIAEKEFTRRKKISNTINGKTERYRIVDEVGFGGKLRAARTKKHLFVDQLATEANVSASTITGIENFRQVYVSESFLTAIGKFFDFDFFQYVKKSENVK